MSRSSRKSAYFAANSRANARCTRGRGSALASAVNLESDEIV